jgi:hypothetical protein
MGILSHTDLEDLSKEQLINQFRDLQLRISRFSAVEQSLINVRDRLDSEIVMHKRMNAFNKEAFEESEESDFLLLVAESIIDIFEFEIGLVIVSSQNSQFSLNYEMEGFSINNEQAYRIYNLLNGNLNYYENGKVLKLNDGQWDDLSKLLLFDQIMLTRAVNQELNVSIYIVGGVLKSGVISYNPVDDKRSNAFGLFAQQVLSQFNSLQKAKRIQSSEYRLSRLAKVFLGFGSSPIENIGKLTDVACELLNADFCFYKGLDKIDLFSNSSSKSSETPIFLSVNDIVYLKTFINNRSDKMLEKDK